jgi:hypothetical protein
MANRIMPGRKIVIQTTRVIADGNHEYEVVANIRYAKFNPNILICKLGEEYYIIKKSALQALIFSKKPSAPSVSIYKSVNEEVRSKTKSKS